MQSTKFTLKWKDAINAIIMMVIANMLMIVMAAADGKFPTSLEFKVGLINSVKFAIIPYLLKNFFTDDMKQAEKIIKKETDKINSENNKL